MVVFQKLEGKNTTLKFRNQNWKEKPLPSIFEIKNWKEKPLP